MATTTDDRFVAAFYGAITYASLRPGVLTTVDLLAGQPGPWTLADDGLAATAADLVSRLGATPAIEVSTGWAVPADDPVPALAGACQDMRTLLASPGLDGLPAHLTHQLLELDQRVEALAGSLAALDQPTSAGPDEADTPAGAAAAGPAVEWSRSELMAFVTGSGFDLNVPLAELRRYAAATGHPEPKTWAAVVGDRVLLAHLMAWISDALEAAR